MNPTQRLIICCDGTWNTLDMEDRGVPAPTNVVRLHNAVTLMDEAGVSQKSYYHPGVGTDAGPIRRLLGGSMGVGLDQNIMSAYRTLCDHYTPETDIFLFGFSRGAYTARSLAGFVRRCGLLDLTGLTDTELWQRIGETFDKGYRKKHAEWPVRSGWPLLPVPGGRQTVPIRFIGVWDTVGALGIPDELAFANIFDNPLKHAFHDTDLGDNIQTARHAVAMDERRQTFQPTLWTKFEGRDVKQIWFPGGHGDVGGGYKETGLSDGALAWMMLEAEAEGLHYDPAFTAQIHPNPSDIQHRGERGVFAVLPTMPRAVPAASSSDLHRSVVERRAAPPITQAPYRPETPLISGMPLTIDIYANQPWNETGLYLNAGQPYIFSAEGEWLDAGMRCSPEGATDSPFRLGRIFQALGGLGDLAEPVFQKITGNPNADFRFSRRHHDMPWFCLVGAIANGGISNQTILEHVSFRIGRGPVTYTPREPGYFYAYANDAWGFYGNNRGRVRLTVKG